MVRAAVLLLVLSFVGCAATTSSRSGIEPVHLHDERGYLNAPMGIPTIRQASDATGQEFMRCYQRFGGADTSEPARVELQLVLRGRDVMVRVVGSRDEFTASLRSCVQTELIEAGVTLPDTDLSRWPVVMGRWSADPKERTATPVTPPGP